MNLAGSLAKTQESAARYYLQFAEFFKDNKMIRDTWTAMSQDFMQQAGCVRRLPQSFWNHWKDDAGHILEGVSEPGCKPSNDQSLHHCLRIVLDFEEPLILKSYVPLIRRLRAHWTEHSLDFYIIVKAHVARLTRIVDQFSGDPTLIQRATDLLDRFEREVQAPRSLAILSKGVSSAKAKAPAKRAAAKNRSGRTPPRVLHKSRTKVAAAKPLVKRLARTRRRAQG